MNKMLEMLVAQAAGKGCDLITLRALVEEAAEAGARRALAAVGNAETPNTSPGEPHAPPAGAE